METFIVRLWKPRDETETASVASNLHGVLEHVGSPETIAFASDDELVAALRSGLSDENTRLPENERGAGT